MREGLGVVEREPASRRTISVGGSVGGHGEMHIVTVNTACLE